MTWLIYGTPWNTFDSYLYISHVMRWWYFLSFVTSSNAHAQPSNGARCLIFGQTLRLLPYFMCANSEGSGETVRMWRLAWAFAGRLCDKYHDLMSWLIYCFPSKFFYIIGHHSSRHKYSHKSTQIFPQVHLSCFGYFWKTRSPSHNFLVVKQTFKKCKPLDLSKLTKRNWSNVNFGSVYFAALYYLLQWKHSKLTLITYMGKLFYYLTYHNEV